ncbi:MAG: ABC transporter permease subunit [Planctomycetales bacterium]|nr:ABC transporter permease subunit [Planctomycetales bacterium]NIM10204.1 ABC transporter permease subunit [Planctomycetales bacterium]NIN09621.1 ABC transporter permease subunit [Planctomycetales bacterium]NIN78747.1 ABC transporter permease subunit [Planctomycetales bacterium]NIO35921.1 ABC transporter permease subunit [Planctomycetales bacterium]
MTAYFVRRLLLIIPTFVGVTIIAFFITRMVPGGPLEREIMQMRHAMATQGGSGTQTLETEITDDLLDELKRTFGLDKPWYVAYVLWLKNLATLNLGDSYETGEPVWERVIERFPISISFGLTGFLLAYLVCIPLGIAKALRHGHPFDYISSAIVFIGYSIPGWAMGILLLLFFASGRYVDLFPLGGIKSDSYETLPWLARQIQDPQAAADDFGDFDWSYLSPAAKAIDRVWHMLLPVFCYMMGSFAALTVLTKNSLMENLGQDYVRTAFAKGLAPRRVIFLHTLRNSLIPLATGLGHALGLLMAGSYLIELVFNIDGLGLLGFTAITGRDYAVVMGVLAINTLLLLFGNIMSDVLYALIDPRIRFE